MKQVNYIKPKYAKSVLYARYGFGRIQVARAKTTQEADWLKRLHFDRVDEIRNADKVWS
jgi:hypothetical protein